jgi:hypothetical protein
VLEGLEKDAREVKKGLWVDSVPDVGPILGRFLPRADDFFGDLFSLTLPDELIRRQVSE